MASTQAYLLCFRKLGIVLGLIGMISSSGLPAHAVVKIFDGFGDADRNNDGLINLYDSDLNFSGTLNDPVSDAALSSRGIIEVTTAENPSDVGIVWSGIRSYDTAANLVKSNAKIINDDVATGTETTTNIHNSGLALGVESRGTGSSLMGRFNQAVEVGPMTGDKLVVSIDFRYWSESTNAIITPFALNELRWGLFQDTDGELGSTGPYGNNGATVEWGKDDGNWFASQPGAEGDKGIFTRMEFGSDALAEFSRINWEYNVLNINGTANNGRIFEGSGVSSTPGSGGDTGTLAIPGGDGPGGIIHGDLSSSTPHTLSMEFIRLEDGLLQVATFVDGVEALRDEIKTTDTGFDVLGPPASSFNYIAFRNAVGDFDYVLDNLKVEVFGSNAEEETGDFDGDGDVDGRDFLLWQRGGSPNALSAGDLALWQAQYGTNPPLSAVRAVPEPASLSVLGLGLVLLAGVRKRFD
jgi:hypothetical protein